MAEKPSPYEATALPAARAGIKEDLLDLVGSLEAAMMDLVGEAEAVREVHEIINQMRSLIEQL